MSWFQLDPPAIASRTGSSSLPTLGASILRGIVGFTIVSVAGFAPWAFFGRWFYRHRPYGEIGLYVICAMVFIVLSGLLMHRLILGAGSLSRFYKLFSLAFAAYAAAWIGGWMALRGHPGSFAGLLAGTAIMGWMLARAFDAAGAVVKIIAALFVLNAAGYFIGGWLEAAFIHSNATVAKLLWGVSYGVGFGAGLGLAFHLCQARARAAIASQSSIQP